jgi:hypothetical protein
MASTFFVLNGLVGCGHMSGLVARAHMSAGQPHRKATATPLKAGNNELSRAHDMIRRLRASFGFDHHRNAPSRILWNGSTFPRKNAKAGEVQ